MYKRSFTAGPVFPEWTWGITRHISYYEDRIVF